MKGPGRILPFVFYLSPFAFSSCGYHVAGRADVLPKNVRTIAIPAFGNVTTRYKVGNLLTGAITREFISRTRFRIVADPDQADAVLSGAVINYSSYPTTLDRATNRATGVQVIIQLQISLRDRSTNKVLWERPRMEFRQFYEISIDPKAYFDESDVALDRLSRDVARTVVSAVIENF